MAGFRKRTFAGRGSKRPFKKARRTFKRRSVRRGANSVAYNNQNGIGKSLPFKGRKLTKKSWNHKLWDSTLQKAHYRSNGAIGGVLSTPNLNTQVTIVTAQALNNGVAQFWQTGGGAIEVNDGFGVPTFEDDIIVRGGKVGITLFNLGGDGAAGNSPVRAEVFLVKQSPRPTLSNLPGTAFVGWDPTIIPEFKRDIGTIVFRREIIIEPGQLFACERRIPIMKIDQESFSTDNQRWIWIVAANDFENTSAVSVNIITFFNLSFSADVNNPSV